MMRRLGVDFGETETVLAELSGRGNGSESETVLSEPNLVHITDEGTRIMGQEVVDKGLERSVSTARHLRHYILMNSPVLARCGCHTASYRDLGHEFLVSLIRRSAASGNGGIQEIVFSVPEGAPAHYHEWLVSVGAESGIPECSLMDEISAATRGYGIPVERDQILMLVDVGSEALEVTVAGLLPTASGSFHASQVIARAVSDTGTQAIDSWIAEEVYARCRKRSWEVNNRTHHPRLLAACRAAREDLSVREVAEITFGDQDTKEEISTSLTRSDLETILDRQGIGAMLKRTISRAVAHAQCRGYGPDRIRHVLMTGKGSFIPSIRAVVASETGKEPVLCDLPCSAKALGSARYHTGAGNARSLQCDYAIRYWDAGTGRHEYRYIARRGTAYPSGKDTARLLISAAYDGQTHLGIAIYAFGNGLTGPASREIELVTDPAGKTRCIEQPENFFASRATWINETAPTILVATPPGHKGDVRFELGFSIDSVGTLRLSARDVLTGEIVFENHACGKLK